VREIDLIETNSELSSANRNSLIDLELLWKSMHKIIKLTILPPLNMTIITKLLLLLLPSH
jgi:hypothetical protein